MRRGAVLAMCRLCTYVRAGRPGPDRAAPRRISGGAQAMPPKFKPEYQNPGVEASFAPKSPNAPCSEPRPDDFTPQAMDDEVLAPIFPRAASPPTDHMFNALPPRPLVERARRRPPAPMPEIAIGWQVVGQGRGQDGSDGPLALRMRERAGYAMGPVQAGNAHYRDIDWVLYRFERNSGWDQDPRRSAQGLPKSMIETQNSATGCSIFRLRTPLSQIGIRLGQPPQQP